jgi:hypothetical protein
MKTLCYLQKCAKQNPVSSIRTIDDLKFYVDGSLFEGKAGSEVCFWNELGVFTTVFQTAIHAVLACFDNWLKKCISGIKICIYFDS